MLIILQCRWCGFCFEEPHHPSRRWNDRRSKLLQPLGHLRETQLGDRALLHHHKTWATLVEECVTDQICHFSQVCACTDLAEQNLLVWLYQG